MPSPYAKALDMLGKRDLPQPDDEDVKRGRLMEATTIAALVEHGHQARQLRHYCLHPDNEEFMASPDYELDGHILGEGKAPIAWDEWTGGPPLHVRLQAQWQMACGERCQHMITGLFVDRHSIELQCYPTERHDHIINLMEERAAWFLDLVDAGKTPEPDASKSSYRALQEVMDVEETLRITIKDPDSTERLMAWQQARLDRLVAEKTEEAAKHWFAMHAGEAGVIETYDGELLFRRVVEPKGKSKYWKWGFSKCPILSPAMIRWRYSIRPSSSRCSASPMPWRKPSWCRSTFEARWLIA